jgi:Sec-independent protein translocase protein TatA
LGIFEILLFLIIALIVIPPDDLPQVMRTAGKLMRELRLASNTVMREISSAIGDEQPYNLLPPRLEDPPPSAPSSSPPAPAPQGFLAPQSPPSTADQPAAEIVTPAADPSAPGDAAPNAHDAAVAAAPAPAVAAEQAERSGPPAAKP